MGELADMPVPKKPLTEEQIEYWEDKLEVAERAREYALRMLGRLGVERGLDG